MKKNSICISFLIIFFTSCSSFASEDLFKGPWGNESFSEAPSNFTISQSKRKKESLLSKPFIKGLRFFQDVISPVDGDRCPMHPSCSEYGIRALRKHGFFLGSLMIVDRLFRERDERQYAPKMIVNGKWKYFDPLEENDFWFGGD